MSRSVLAQSSPNSRHVFRWPLEDATSGAAEGTLLNPIVMGDTDPAAFQDYLWILHERYATGAMLLTLLTILRAPATEEFLASKPTEFKLRRLLHIVIFTHKYQNAELQSWARRNCLAVLFSRTVPLHPPLIALTIAATALFPPGEPTRRAFEQLIRGYLRYDAGDGSDESNARALLQRVDIIDLISECEAAGLFNLAAHARYTLLLLPRSAWESSERLTRAERLTLLCGSDALIQRWLSIRDLTMGLRDRSGRKRVDRLMLFAVEVDTGPSALLHKLRAIKPVVDDLCLAAGAPEQTSNVQGVIAEELKTLEDHMDLYFDVSKKGFSLQGQVV